MITRIFGGIHLPVRSRRAGTLAAVTVFLAVLILVAVLGHIWENDALVTDFGRKNLRPGTAYLFGTDWLGRDMLKRTAAGLSMSIRLGIVTAAPSAVIAVILGTAAAVLGKAADMAVSGLIDMMMGIPHMLLLILISFAFGKGFTGVAAGIALTHWPSLARLIRAEVLQLKASQYVKISEKLGMGKWRIAVEHMLPHLVPRFLTGLVLMFPHAILHEASITFRSSAGGTRHRNYPVGKYEVSDNRKMVAGRLPGSRAGGNGSGVSGPGAERKQPVGSAKRA